MEGSLSPGKDLFYPSALSKRPSLPHKGQKTDKLPQRVIAVTFFLTSDMSFQVLSAK